ncbi:NAD(+) kinase [Fastidiosibacter lacustris]|uniref:NAD(+) kinase n=1 Tax=Fastidiosibacter lacustris TaxID=2056695 RepID=UPI000E340F44|nr:NAD(+) kinase [Fastidiosibacter lacustris]
MTFIFNKVAIIGTHDNPAVAETVEYLMHSLIEQSLRVYLEAETAASLDDRFGEGYSLKAIAKHCEIAIVVGGDGNFLNAGRNLSLISDIPIVGINRGKLGFLTDINPDQITTRLFDVLCGRYQQEQRFMLQASITSEHHPTEQTVALNDIVIAAGQHSRLFQMHVHIDGRYAFDQRADGMIIATPTGSTAHALSAGGPIMHPGLDAIVLVPMFSHSLNSRPIVLNANSQIEITIGEYNNPEPSLSFDGHMKLQLRPADTIKLHRCKKSVSILHPLDYDYFHSLRSKLHWGKMLFP